MSKMNRLATCQNPYQGTFKRVLCVCSAGLLRSPTTALVLSQEPYNFNTRAAGLSTEFALIPVDFVLVAWADEIVCMENSQVHKLKSNFEVEVPVYSLNIPDDFQYRDAELIKLIKEHYNLASNFNKDTQLVIPQKGVYVN